jgi:hypothetical protein
MSVPSSFYVLNLFEEMRQIYEDKIKTFFEEYVTQVIASGDKSLIKLFRCSDICMKTRRSVISLRGAVSLMSVVRIPDSFYHHNFINLPQKHRPMPGSGLL